MQKIYPNAESALEGLLFDGMTIAAGGFGLCGIPSALIRFEGEFHGTGSKPSNFMRTQLYMMSWYQRWRRSGTSVTTAME